MSQKILAENGEDEIEVFTADEVKAQSEAAAAAVRGELEPKLTAAEAEKVRLDGLLKERAKEFAGFRELNAEQIAKLDEKDRIIYENQVQIKKDADQRIADGQKAHKDAVAAAIKGKAGDNTKLIEKMTSMWDVITVDATTPEQIEAKLLMVLGAISTTTPDLIASVAGFSGGGYIPPKTGGKAGDSFADSDAGKGLAKSLGLMTEPPKK